MKFRLSSGANSIVSRSVVVQMAGHWLFGPLRELLKIVAAQQSSAPASPAPVSVDAAAAPPDDGVDGASKDSETGSTIAGTAYENPAGDGVEKDATPSATAVVAPAVGLAFPHLFIDVNKRNPENYTLLMKAVQYRLYGLISVFISLGCNGLVEAMRVAVINGDDLAVGLLLRSSGIQQQQQQQASISSFSASSSIFDRSVPITVLKQNLLDTNSPADSSSGDGDIAVEENLRLVWNILEDYVGVKDSAERAEKGAEDSVVVDLSATVGGGVGVSKMREELEGRSDAEGSSSWREGAVQFVDLLLLAEELSFAHIKRRLAIGYFNAAVRALMQEIRGKAANSTAYMIDKERKIDNIQEMEKQMAVFAEVLQRMGGVEAALDVFNEYLPSHLALSAAVGETDPPRVCLLGQGEIRGECSIDPAERSASVGNQRISSINAVTNSETIHADRGSEESERRETSEHWITESGEVFPQRVLRGGFLDIGLSAAHLASAAATAAETASREASTHEPEVPPFSLSPDAPPTAAPSARGDRARVCLIDRAAVIADGMISVSAASKVLKAQPRERDASGGNAEGLSLTVREFYAKYVRLNRPIVIDYSALFNASSSQSEWHLDALLESFGSVPMRTAEIPYGELFGKPQELTNLTAFAIISNNNNSSSHGSQKKGMRQFSRSLVEAGERAGDSGAGVQLAVGWSAPGPSNPSSTSSPPSRQRGASSNAPTQALSLPQYVFAGSNEELTSALAKRISRTIDGLTGFLSFIQSTLPSYTSSSSSPASAAPPTTSTNSGKKARQERGFAEWMHKSRTPPPVHLQVYMGPPLSGAPLHHHGPAFNFLAFGRKLWTLLPPGRDVYTNMHPLEWLLSDSFSSERYPYSGDETTEDGPCTYEQQAGELIYVPRHYSHQVLNLAESVGFAVEVKKYVH